MLHHLRHMAVFAKVVDNGSFRATARELEVAPSRVSETVSELERFFGTTLLYRDTRKISVTSDGWILYPRAAEILRNLEASLDDLNVHGDHLSGVLKVSAPAFLSEAGFARVVGKFMKLHPHVDMDISMSDRRVDLVSEGIDLSIRAGEMDDSALMSLKLGVGSRVLVASPHYVAERPAPTGPQDLEGWDWLHLMRLHEQFTLTSAEGAQVTIQCPSRLRVDTARALAEFATQGVGVSVILRDIARPLLQQGQLVEVLPGWCPDPLTYRAVWPDQSRRKTLSVHFARFLADHLQFT